MCGIIYNTNSERLLSITGTGLQGGYLRKLSKIRKRFVFLTSLQSRFKQGFHKGLIQYTTTTTTTTTTLTRAVICSIDVQVPKLTRAPPARTFHVVTTALNVHVTNFLYSNL